MGCLVQLKQGLCEPVLQSLLKKEYSIHDDLYQKCIIHIVNNLFYKRILDFKMVYFGHICHW